MALHLEVRSLGASAMIFCRFRKGGSSAYGIVQDTSVLEVEGDLYGEFKPTGLEYRLDDLEILVPVIPGTFYAIGSNYRDHIIGRAKVRGRAPRFYDVPRVGYRANSALIPHGADIIKPSDAGPNFEYEGELVAVIGKTLRRASLGRGNGGYIRLDHWQRCQRTRLAGGGPDNFAQ